jgi:hypothetical protein
MCFSFSIELAYSPLVMIYVWFVSLCPHISQGIYYIDWGTAWMKGVTIKEMGQCPVMRYNKLLLDCIMNNRLPVASVINTKIVPLSEAPEAYKKFNKGEPVKYVLDPTGELTSSTTVSPSEPERETETTTRDRTDTSGKSSSKDRGRSTGQKAFF